MEAQLPRQCPSPSPQLGNEGETEEVEAFVEGIAESQLKSHIKSVTAIPIPPLTGVRGFEIAEEVSGTDGRFSRRFAAANQIADRSIVVLIVIQPTAFSSPRRKVPVWVDQK